MTAAAVLADVDENIRQFGKGYETVLGERGVTVSGGQKQRISIARALMKDAANLRRTRAGKTTILIAHRISTIEKMDKILFLDDGALIAAGTHAQLCESCPEYRKMVELQKLEEEGAHHAD